MSKTLTIAAQRQVDETNRSRIDYPSGGYVVSNASELQVQDELPVPASTTRTLWSKLAADGITDDWGAVWIEAKESNLELLITLLDNADANPRTVQLPLQVGAPIVLASRLNWQINPDATLYYVSQLDVVESLAATTAKVDFTIARQ